jgi:HemK-related putative methylase
VPEKPELLLGSVSSSPLHRLAGKALTLGMRACGFRHYDDYRLENVSGLRILVLPGVANPRLLRTGAFFASCVSAQEFAGRSVLDVGTGSGVCALAAARHTGSVVATDISRAAVRCARVNALTNQLEHRIDIRHGDLFEPVSGQRFDRVLFNPPFQRGQPRDERDAAWRSVDVAARFARGLDAHLAPGGHALLLLSTFGNACRDFIEELRTRSFELEVFARRHHVNEIVTVLRVSRSPR